MYIASIKYCDCANGPGIRTSVFVSGCENHCKGCFNEVAWDFYYGVPFTPKVEGDILNSLRESQVAGLTILGGEPMSIFNQNDVSRLINSVRHNFSNEKSIWLYTGYTLDNIPVTHWTKHILANTDVIVDGPFVEEEKDISLLFRGSRNQRIIGVKQTFSDSLNNITNMNISEVTKLLKEAKVIYL